MSVVTNAAEIAQIRSFCAQHAVLTIGALDARAGATDFNIKEAQVARAMIDPAERVTVLADSSIFDHIAAFEVCALSRIATLVYEDAPQDALAQALKAAGVRLIEPGLSEQEVFVTAGSRKRRNSHVVRPNSHAQRTVG